MQASMKPSFFLTALPPALPIAVATLAILLLTGAPLAPIAQADEAPAAREDEQADEHDRFEALRAKRWAALGEADLLDVDARTAAGQDPAALRSRALGLRLEAATLLGEMGELVRALESNEGDTAAEHKALAGLVPEHLQSLKTDYASQSKTLAKLKTAFSEAADIDAATTIAASIQRQEVLLLEILTHSVDAIDLAKLLGLPEKSMRRWLDERIQARSRLAISQLDFTIQELSEINTRLEAGADPTALQSRKSAARSRLEASTTSLGTLIGLMERLEIESDRYQQALVESTGELTLDAIDREVAGDLISSWTSGIRESVIENGPGMVFRALLFAIIAAFFWGLSRFVQKIVAKALNAPNLRLSQLLKRMLVSLSTGAVLVLGLLVALSQLGIEIGPMLTGLGIAGFVLGFALQDTLGNFAAGVMILVYRPFDVGDMIDCAGGVFGNVNHMSLVSTTILTIDNKTLIVPNSKIWGDVITNVTAQAIRRVDLEFGIGYGDDIPFAEGVLESVLADHPKVLENPEPMVRVHSLGDSSVNFVVRPWCARDDYWDVFWDVTREVKLRFDREGVSIPFPQRDVHFYPTEPDAALSPAHPADPEAEFRTEPAPMSATDEPESEES